VKAAMLLATLVAGGCSDPGGLGDATPWKALDYDQFVCTVQPTLIRRCSYLACHGNADHALRVFSIGKLRITEPLTRAERSETLLTADEVDANWRSASALAASGPADARAAGDPAGVVLLSKPLASDFGGSEHQGLAIFPAWPAGTLGDDAEWKALVAWVGGAKQPSPHTADCTTLFANMQLTPRSGP